MATSDKNSRLVDKDKILSGKPYIIPQPEPLYTVRPRYFKDKSNRGRRATFRIKSRGVRGTPSTSAAASLSQRVREKLVGQTGYTDFILQSIQVGFNEKTQIMQTFGDAETVYYFGRTPTMISLSGTLLDDLDNDWFVRFVSGYNDFLRGTQLAKNFEIVEISTDNATFTGSLMNLQFSQNSNNDASIPFTCTMLIKTFEYHSSYQFGAELAGDIKTSYEALPNANSAKDSPKLTQGDINRLKATSRLTDEEIISLVSGVDGPTLGLSTAPSDSEMPSLGASLAPSGTYATEALSSFNESLGAISEKINKLSDGINKFAGAIDEALTGTLDPINQIIGSVNDISSAAFSVVAAIDNTIDSVLDPISTVAINLETTRRQLKNLSGTITSLPESMSEKISRFIRAGGLVNTSFLQSPSAGINQGEALATMGTSNIRTARSTGRVGPASDATDTADQVARL